MGDGVLSWERNTRNAPRAFHVYARIAGENVKVNAPGTQGANGGIDDGKLIYQQYVDEQSDIRIFDLATRTRGIPPNINTPQWEYWPSIEGSRVLFGRLRPNGARRIIIFNTLTNLGETVEMTKAKSRFLGPGQINGDYATWYKCTPETCDVFGYQVSTGTKFKVPNPGRFQRASSVGSDGTVYFARSGEACGSSVRLMAYRPDGTVERLTQLPDGRDITDTYADNVAAGTTEVFYDNSDCDEAHRSDIFKVVDISDKPLTVTKTGDGAGTVASAPAGIDCGATCSALFDAGTEVTLVATPATGSTFVGWSGDGCSGTGTCTVTMSQARNVNAEFEGPPESFTLNVAKGGGGTGLVTSNPAGINCGTDCTESILEGTTVTLTASATGGSTFVGWIGGGCGTAGTGPCTFVMDGNKTITANFNASNTMTVLKSGNGDGIVTSSPSGISCGSDCTETYAPGTLVTLTASIPFGSESVFTGWSGEGCSGTGTCSVTMNQARVVTATFDLYKLTVDPNNGDGSGTVTATNIDCASGAPAGPDCTQTYQNATIVTLTASETTPGHTFTGWSANCTPTGALTCDVNVDAAKTVTASFNDPTLPIGTLTVDPTAGDGTGTVTGSGINCAGNPAGPDCTEAFMDGPTVTLTASETTPTNTFVSWSANCTPTGPLTCEITMDSDKTVTAAFNDPAVGPSRSVIPRQPMSSVWERLLLSPSTGPSRW
jgi:hypothetical protein